MMKNYVPGLVLIICIYLIATLLTHYQIGSQLGFSPLTFAILIGMLVGNTIYPKLAPRTDKGVAFAKGQLLRLGIILYGFRLTFAQVAGLGLGTIFIDLFMVSSTFLLTYWIGYKYLNMEKNTVILTGAGCSICGAAAVMATASLIKAKTTETTQAIAVVVLFGTLAIFLYPWLYTLLFDPKDAVNFGIVVGSSVHEVAQVVAVGKQISDGTMDLAVVTKMLRVIMLAPFLFILLYFINRDQTEISAKNKVTIPWFAVLFLVMIAINSIINIPGQATQLITQVDNILLTMAMAGLGLTTHFSAFKKAGPKALLLGVIVFIWLIVASLVAYYLVIA